MGRIQIPEINQCLYVQLIFDNGSKTIQWGKDSLFNKWSSGIGQIHAKNETRPLTYTIHKNKLKCIKDLNVRVKTVKILEPNTGSKILNIFHSNIFSELSPQEKETKEK